MTDEMRLLARNLVDHLTDMHEAKRLNAAVFLLAVDSLELVPGMQECAASLRNAALGERDR